METQHRAELDQKSLLWILLRKYWVFLIGLAYRQIHILNFRVLIFVLKLFRDVAVLYFSSRFAKSNGVLYFTVSKPYLTVSFESFDIIWKFQILWLFSRNEKKSSMIDGTKPLIILKTSSINTCKFLWCFVVSLFICTRCSKAMALSFVINLRELSLILLIRLFAFREQSIQNEGQPYF